jgi:hypothetical protein
MRPGFVLILGLTLMGIVVQPARADLVLNGSFGTGDFTDWSGDSSIQIDNGNPEPGDLLDAAFTGTGVLSQTLATAFGQEYTLSFSILSESGNFFDTLTVNFGSLSETITGDLAAGGYQTEVFDVPGSDIAGGDTLSFQASNPFTSDGSPDEPFNLDDVSVVPVVTSAPEPPAGVILAGAVLMILSLRFRRRSTEG